MKRLLLGPALALPLILGLCSFHTKVPELPKVPEVVGSVSSAAREIPLDDFKQFPPIPAVPPVPIKKPVVRHKPALHHEKPKVTKAPVKAPVAPEEPLPPQQGPICIFPFSMIPNCTPQVAGQ
jgi:hypothetical protein